MVLSFEAWKRALFASSGTASVPVRNLGEFVLEVLWRDGCEPTIAALLDYVQSGIHPAYQARRAAASLPKAPLLR
jgi:hypothetical protein